MERREALIDGDVLLYQIACSHEYLLYVEDNDHYTFETTAKKQLEDMPSNVSFMLEDYNSVEEDMKERISQITQLAQCDWAKIFLSDEVTFRHEMFSEYKQNRNTLDKPVWYDELRDYLIDICNATVDYQLEADDSMAQAAIQSEYHPVICTIDKDLLQVPVRVYNWDTDEVFDVEDYIGDERAEGFPLFCMQVLAGDPVDNYKGCKSIGWKKAYRVLSQCSTNYKMWQQVEALYEQKDHSIDYLWLQANIAYIRQYPGETAQMYVERKIGETLNGNKKVSKDKREEAGKDD